MAKRRNRNKRSNRNTVTKAGGAKRTSVPAIAARVSAAEDAAKTTSAPTPTSTPAPTSTATPRTEAKRASTLPQAAQVVAFTELEEAFFAAGESEPHLEQVAAAEDEAAAEQRRPSLWKRLFARAA